MGDCAFLGSSLSAYVSDLFQRAPNPRCGLDRRSAIPIRLFCSRKETPPETQFTPDQYTKLIAGRIKGHIMRVMALANGIEACLLHPIGFAIVIGIGRIITPASNVLVRIRSINVDNAFH